MHHRTRWIALSLSLAVTAATSGCGKQAGKPPLASIPGSAAASTDEPKRADADRPHGDQDHPIAILHTSLGDITLRLNADRAPITVDNFLAYAEKGQYDNTIFHQVLTKPAVIMTGGYNTFQKEKPAGETIRNEAANGLKNVRGTVGMTRRPDSIDSSTCQFYINAADNPQLDNKSNEPDGYGYCVFGEVISGMNVVDKIAEAALHDTEHLKSTPVEQVVVKWVHFEK